MNCQHMNLIELLSMLFFKVRKIRKRSNLLFWYFLPIFSKNSMSNCPHDCFKMLQSQSKNTYGSYVHSRVIKRIFDQIRINNSQYG